MSQKELNLVSEPGKGVIFLNLVRLSNEICSNGVQFWLSRSSNYGACIVIRLDTDLFEDFEREYDSSEEILRLLELGIGLSSQNEISIRRFHENNTTVIGKYVVDRNGVTEESLAQNKIDDVSALPGAAFMQIPVSEPEKVILGWFASAKKSGIDMEK